MKYWREFSIRDEFETRQMAWAAAVRDEAFKAGQEMSGAAVPWMARYFPELAHGGATYHRRKREERETDVSAMLAAQDFWRFWDATMARLGDVERQADDLIVAVDRELTQAEQALTDIQSRAETLGDGTRIYPDRDGTLRAEDGAIVDLDAAGRPADALPAMPGIARPSWEEFTAARDRRDALLIASQEVQALAVELGDVRNDLGEAKENKDLWAVQEVVGELDRIGSELSRIESNVTLKAPEVVFKTTRAQQEDRPLFDVSAIKPLEIGLRN